MSSAAENNLTNEISFPWAAPTTILFVLWGSFVRVFQFAQYNSLSLDEAALAANIADRNWSNLFGPLDITQVAPPGYLLLAKTSVVLFGESEYAFRFPSLLTSLMGLILFALLVRKIFDPVTAAIATALFATSGHLIYYAWQCKPYATDVTAFIVIALSCITFMQHSGLTWIRVIAYGLIGAVSLWFSYPAVFVLAGIGGAHLVCQTQYKNWTQVRFIILAIAIWIIGFIILYLTHLVPIQEHSQLMGRMQTYWTAGFMPLPPTSLNDLAWFRETFLRFFWMPGGFRLTGLAGFAFLAGCVHLAFHHRFHLGLFALPILAALLASGLQQYPFDGRLLLFLSPSLFVLIAVGMGAIVRSLPGRQAIVGLLLVAMLALPPTLRTVRNAAIPRPASDYKAALQHFADNAHPDDLLYIRSADQFIFRFSRQDINLESANIYIEPQEIAVEHRDIEHLKTQIPTLKNAPQVWFPFAYDAAYTITPVLDFLNTQAALQEEFHSPGTALYAYSFGEQTSSK